MEGNARGQWRRSWGGGLHDIKSPGEGGRRHDAREKARMSCASWRLPFPMMHGKREGCRFLEKNDVACCPLSSSLSASNWSPSETKRTTYSEIASLNLVVVLFPTDAC